MKAFFILLLFFPVIALSQSARFVEIRVKALSENLKTESATIIYPVIVLDNKSAADRINHYMKKNIADNYADDTSLVIDSSLHSAAANGLTGITYEIIYNKNGILSFILWLEGIGAYPTWWKETMNFDLTTGKPIELKEIFLSEKFDVFKERVYQNKIRALAEYKKELKQASDGKEIDKATHEWALKEVNDHCLTSVSLAKFALSNTQIEIFDDCEFPHAIIALSPAYDLKYKLSDLKMSLKQKILKQLTR